MIGNGLQFAGPRYRLLRWFCLVGEKAGLETQRLIVPGLHPAILISDPALVDFVLARPHIFTKGDDFKLKTKPFLGHGIFNSEGALWRKERKAGAQFLSSQQLRHMVDENLTRCWATMRNDLNQAVAAGSMVDLQYLFLSATTKTMGDMAFNADLDPASDYCRDFEFANGVVATRAQDPLWAVREFLSHPNPFTTSKIIKSFETVRYMSYQLVETALYGKAAKTLREKGGFGAQPSPIPALGDTGAVERKTFIHHLAEQISDTQTIAEVAITFLIAGRDTTAQGLTWTMWTLLRNPHVIQRMRSELAPLKQADGSLDLSFDNLHPSVIPYIMAVFYEALRLFPPVPLELKETEHAVTLPDGTHLPPQRLVIWCLWSMGRSKQIWGPDAANFNPDRWLEDEHIGEEAQGRSETNGEIYGVQKKTKKVFLPRSQGEYPVFNGGPRLCLGKRMAEVQACYFLANLVWNYDFAEVLEGPDKGYLYFGGGEKRGERMCRISLTLPMEGGLPCYVRKL